MQSNIAKKIFSIMLSLCLILQMGVGTVFADLNAPKYTSFEIPADKQKITVPVGTTEEAVRAQLPMKFNATIEETATTTGSALNVEVNMDRWLCDGFSSETSGEEFEFKGVPVWPYALADGTEHPIIKVKIEGELVLPDGMTLVEGATYGGDISNRELSLIGGLPDKKMQYKAGDGYLLFIPASPGGNPTIELNDANIEQPGPEPFDLPEIEVDMLFKGSTTLYGDLPQDANITLAPNAEFELKQADGSGETLDYTVVNKMIIGENAKLIIDEEVAFIVRERAADDSSLIDSKGSIIVRGGLRFYDPSYGADIVTMNISTEGSGRVMLDREAINPENGKIAFDENEGLGLSKYNAGEYSCGSGTIKWEPALDATSGALTGGTLTMDNADIKIKDEDIRNPAIFVEGADVPITLNVIGNNTLENPYGHGININNLTLTGSGNLTVKGKMPIVYETEFKIDSFTGNLNSLVIKYQDHPNGALRYAVTYGNVSFGDDEYYKEFTVNEGSKLTVEPGANLRTEEFTSNGEIINNGTLHLKRDVNDAELNNWVYDSLNLKGNGIVAVTQIGGGSIKVLFTNEGKRINEINTPLDFSTATEDKGELAKDGYHWDNTSKTLILENLIMAGLTDAENTDAISLPEGEAVTVILKGYNKIEGFKSSIAQGTIQNGALLPEASGSLTITGDGLLTSIPSTSNSSITKVLTTTGKLVMQSGSLMMKGEAKRGIDAAGVELKGGTIGSDSINATINSYGDFVMSGGKAVTGIGDGGSLVVCGDISITGGDLVTQDDYNGIMIQEGNFSMTGGMLTIHNSGNSKSTGITMGSMRGGHKKFSITGGVLDIKSGTAAIASMGFAGEEESFVFETIGMDIATAPKGGILKSLFIPMPLMSGPGPILPMPGPGSIPPMPEPGPILPGEAPAMPMGIKIYSFTADKELKMEMGMGMEGPVVKNACKEINIVKAAVKPTDPNKPNKPNKPTNPSDGSSSGGGGGAAIPAQKSEAPTKASTVVTATVTDKTASISVSKDTVSEAIKKAQEEAKKNANEKNGIVVELKADTKDAKIENISAKLAKDSVAELVKEGVKELSINTGAGKINLDLETLKTIQKQVGSDVSVEAKKVDTATLSAEAKAVIGNRPVYDFSITGENGQKVTEFGNGKISVSLPYTLGETEKAEDLTVYYIDDKGTLKEMKNVVYDEKTKTISFTTNHFSKFAVGKKRATEEAMLQVPVFTDIANHWAKNDIAFVTQSGLFGGTAKDKFSPNMPMTRGMFVTVLGRMANADVSSLDNSKFTDVKAGAYYAPYVEWANKNNIISGTALDKFSPNTPMTREQMAAIMANYSKFAGVNPPKLQSDAKGVATRAQVSAVLRRYIEFLESK